ncbi:protease inhibitor I42 family protein [Priestia megaterium]|uniref:protease inhibitor I42 family protein n=1 Tax=Priestia megaterium TaxID=1404 RepID=UPI00207AE2CC|nr:protease inhibitor I42 family protein [Priestia megaterium]USL45885.1 protease inhibitor I42 family protein [Priestia megaterium]
MKVLNEEDKGKTVTVKVQETLQINLKENASTGFSWLEEITPNQILFLVKEEFVENEFTHGGNTIHRWLYKAIKPGQKKLRFIYQRPWIKDKPSTKEFEVNVYVSI